MSIVTAVVIYVALYLILAILLQDLPQNFFTFSLRAISIDGLSAFLALLIGPLIASRRYRIIVTGLLLYMLFALQIVNIIMALGDFMTFLASVVTLSFTSLGAIGAISIIMHTASTARHQGLKNQIESVEKDTRKGRKRPRTSMFLVVLALFSIPTTYAVMICSAFITLGLCAWIILGLLSIGFYPIVIVVAVLIALVMGFWVTGRALLVMFSPKPFFQPALTMDLNESPYLRKIVKDTCTKVNTAMPDSCILHAEPTFFVMQGKVQTFDGFAQGRILAMGVLPIHTLDTLELQAVLAHEFGHFTGRDTLYSSYIMPVYRAIQSAFEDMQNFGSTSSSSYTSFAGLLLLPSLMFLSAFAQYFSTIDRILSRSRESRADWIAASLYGNRSLSSALMKIAELGHHFAEFAMDIDVKSEDDYFDSYRSVLAQSEKKLMEYKERALRAEEQEFDTHPTLSTRIKSLPITDIFMVDTDTPVSYARKEITYKERQLSQFYINRLKQMKTFYAEAMKVLQERNQAEEITVDDRHLIITCGVCYKKMLVKKGQGVVKFTCPCCSKEHEVKT